MTPRCSSIARTFTFEAAHHLPLLPEGHRCRNLHGHNYRVDVIVEGVLDARGFVMDFAEIEAEAMPLVRLLDHRLLNDVDGLSNPTAEQIAWWFLDRLAFCSRVRVYETDHCWAEAAR